MCVCFWINGQKRPFYVEFQGGKDEGDEKICQVMSTGAILLADIIPSLTIKAMSPFLPVFIK